MRTGANGWRSSRLLILLVSAAILLGVFVIGAITSNSPSSRATVTAVPATEAASSAQPTRRVDGLAGGIPASRAPVRIRPTATSIPIPDYWAQKEADLTYQFNDYVTLSQVATAFLQQVTGDPEAVYDPNRYSPLMQSGIDGQLFAAGIPKPEVSPELAAYFKWRATQIDAGKPETVADYIRWLRKWLR
jgi:hypothetical protein